MQSKQASNIKSLSTRLRLRFGCRKRILQLGAIGAYGWTACKGIGAKAPVWATIPSTHNADCYTCRIMHIPAGYHR
jgi:hypothetical protein